LEVEVTVHGDGGVERLTFNDHRILAEFIAGGIADAVAWDLVRGLPFADVVPAVKATSISQVGRSGLYYEVLVESDGWQERLVFRAHRAVMYRRLVEVSGAKPMDVEVTVLYCNSGLYYSGKILTNITAFRWELEKLLDSGDGVED
jgi:hypothetical protein